MLKIQFGGKKFGDNAFMQKRMLQFHNYLEADFLQIMDSYRIGQKFGEFGEFYQIAKLYSSEVIFKYL